MSEQQTRPVYTNAQREQVRRALLRYMEERGIGVVKLQDAVEKADARGREIPLSTLQRFLAGSHRTQDHHVDLCETFARTLPYYGAAQAIAQLGATLAGFLGAREREGVSADYAASLASAYEGDYEGTSTQKRPAPEEIGGQSKAVTSIMTLSPQPEGPVLAAHEQVLDARGRTHDYEGVMLFTTAPYFALLRNNLTGLPRTLHLQSPPAEAERRTALHGQGFESGPGVAAPLDGGPHSFEIGFSLRPDTGGRAR